MRRLKELKLRDAGDLAALHRRLQAPDAPALDDETAPLDAPDPIINGEIEWGGLMVEFLALALDPYPRKPGVEFQFEAQGEAEHPFAALKKWTKE